MYKRATLTSILMVGFLSLLLYPAETPNVISAHSLVANLTPLLPAEVVPGTRPGRQEVLWKVIIRREGVEGHIGGIDLDRHETMDSVSRQSLYNTTLRCHSSNV